MPYFVTKMLDLIGTSPILRRMVSVFAYAVVPVGGLVLAIFFPSKDVFRQMGELAQMGLLAILFMKPVAFIVPLRFLQRALVYRRQMGVAVFWFALFHGVGFMYLYNILTPGEFLGFANTLLYAGVAMLMMTVLAVTSNDISVRWLRGNWKRLQYLAYPTLFLVIIHSSTVREQTEGVKIFGVLGVFLILKYLQAKKFRLDTYFPFLQKWGL